jgi:outer membrane protein TolC
MMSGRKTMTWRITAVVMLAVAVSHPVQAETSGPLELETAIHLALESHPSIKSVEAEVLASQAKPGQVAAWDDPVLSLMTGIPFETPQDPPLLEAKVTQKLPLSPFYSFKKDAAEAQAEAMATKIPTAQLDVALAVALAYYDVVFLEELRTVVENELELSGNIVEAAALRFASLSGNQADVIRAQISHDEVATALEVLDLDIRAARDTLVLLMGDDRDPQGFDVTIPQYPAVSRSKEELIDLALAQRPELDFFDAKAVAYEKQEKVAKASFAPMLAVTAGYQYKSDTLAGLMGQDAFALGFALNIPIQIKKRKLAVDEAEALGVANEASKEAAILRIAERIVEIRNAIGSLEEKIALQEEKVIPAAGVALELTLAAYAAQNADITDVLTAFDKLLSADEKRSGLRGRYFATYAVLQREVGTFDEPL